MTSYTKLRDDCRYQSHPHHRSARHDKSQWTVDEPTEHESFDLGARAGWIDQDGVHWALHARSGKAIKLGETRAPSREETAIARSRGDIPDIHGYPADPVRVNHDRPPRDIVKKWLDIPSKHRPLRKRQITKMMLGQSCGL